MESGDGYNLRSVGQRVVSESKHLNFTIVSYGIFLHLSEFAHKLAPKDLQNMGFVYYSRKIIMEILVRGESIEG